MLDNLLVFPLLASNIKNEFSTIRIIDFYILLVHNILILCYDLAQKYI